MFKLFKLKMFKYVRVRGGNLNWDQVSDRGTWMNESKFQFQHSPIGNNVDHLVCHVQLTFIVPCSTPVFFSRCWAKCSCDGPASSGAHSRITRQKQNEHHKVYNENSCHESGIVIIVISLVQWPKLTWTDWDLWKFWIFLFTLSWCLSDWWKWQQTSSPLKSTLLTAVVPLCRKSTLELSDGKSYL